jgi:site-specific DNA-methyltransferase (adenine-specific)
MKKEEILKLATLFNGDNIEVLKTLPENSIDSIVTDPPYGISFMSKKWDYDVPSVEFWKEIFRVLKPGGHILSFGGTRTYHRMVISIEDAGFEIRDQIMWVYGSGFPKSHNIGKAVDKKKGETNISKGNGEFEGWGTGLKPANEPICVARKPISEKTIASNVIKWGTGGINVDGCRIGMSQDDKDESYRKELNTIRDGFVKTSKPEYKPEGRFPANFIIECICDEVIEGDKGEVIINEGGYEDTSEIYGKYKNIRTTSYNDKSDFHTNPNCPCRLLDEQSGEGKSTKYKTTLPKIAGNNIFNGGNNGNGRTDIMTDRGYEDKGGASRFFYVPKVSKKERNMGLDGFEDKEKDRGNDLKCGNCGLWILRASGESCKCGEDRIEVRGKAKNTHPTVKPIELMRYLVRLVTPRDGIVLDPFMGSGSTGVATLIEDFKFVGIEMDEDYYEIAKQRVNSHKDFSEFFEEKERKKEKSKARLKKKDPGDDPKLGFWSGRGLNMAA